MKKYLSLFLSIIVIIFTFSVCTETYGKDNSETISALATCNQNEESSTEVSSTEVSQGDTSSENEVMYIYVEYACNEYFAGLARVNGVSSKYIVYCNNALEFKTYDTVMVEFKSEQVYQYVTTISFEFSNEEFQYTTEKRIDNPINARKFTEIVAEKPVIYLYPTEPTKVDVKLDFDGTLTVTIPDYIDGWKVTAYPDGTLVDADGTVYPYLFWEGIPNKSVQITEGFCVEGQDTEAFLREVLPYLGLIESEYEEFIAYWLPRMEENAYNLIQLQTEAYTDTAVLDITPNPDCVLRVFMSFAAVEEYTEIPAQTLKSFKRHGFAAIEWGGCEIKYTEVSHE